MKIIEQGFAAAKHDAGRYGANEAKNILLAMALEGPDDAFVTGYRLGLAHED